MSDRTKVLFVEHNSLIENHHCFITIVPLFQKISFNLLYLQRIWNTIFHFNNKLDKTTVGPSLNKWRDHCLLEVKKCQLPVISLNMRLSINSANYNHKCDLSFLKIFFKNLEHLFTFPRTQLKKMAKLISFGYLTWNV